MKNILLLFSLLSIAFSALHTNEAQAQACCPDFILKDAVEICPPEGSCSSADPGGLHRALAACKNSIHTYTVYPNDLAFTYTWTVTGGTPTSFTGNPNVILWGNGVSGTIKVFISSNDTNFDCSDSISMEVCLIDGPQAGFTFGPDTVCINTPVTFNNTSLGGSVYTWNMGDGTIYTSPNPPPPAHSYSAPGTYIVTLTAKDMGAGQYVGGAQGENKIPCGCSDTATGVVVVLPGVGPTIETDCCYGTVCPGDTSYFCTPMVCASYVWSVTGGTIIPPVNDSCIMVVWDATYSVPTTVTLQSCPGNSCPGSTTLNVPVLYPDLPIVGPNLLCLGASGTYSLPHMPGTFYKWTVSGGPYTFNDKDRNVSLVNISFLAPGSYWVKCQYNNPLAGCNGVDSLQVDVLPKFEILGNEMLCENDPNIFSTNSLIGSPPATWTFFPATPVINSGQGTPSISASFPPGNYVITATSLLPGMHCNLTATKNVVVVAKPILGVITGSLQACPNTNYTYNITSNTSGSPFVWSFLPASAGIILSQMGDDNDSVAVKFNGTGPWTIQVYQEIDLGNGNYCQSLTKTLTVNPYPQPVITGPNPACADNTETYSVSGPIPPGGFQWSISPSQSGTIMTPQGGTSVNIKWHGPAGTAFITVNSCSGSDTYPVVINTPPVALISPNMNPVFCINDPATLILTAQNFGYTFQWYDNNGILLGETGPTLTLNIPSFTNPGTYSYYVIVTNSGCSKTSNIINVIISDCSGGGGGGGCPPNPNPNCAAVCISATELCGVVTLYNSSYAVAPVTIVSYLWTVSPVNGTFLPSNTAANPTLTLTASGTYAITLTVTTSTGCVSSATIYVSVLINASFTVSSPVCENVPATFTANPNNPNYNYLWTFGDGSTSYTAVTQHAYVSAALSPYTVTLTITDNNGCVAATSSLVYVNPTPVCNITAPDTAFCPGSFLVLSACTGMNSYQWYKNGTPISGATNDTLHASKYGQYWVEVTGSNGCPGISNKMYVYEHKKPKAKITGDGYFCEFAGGTSAFPLYTIYDPNYSYNWSSIPPSGVTFSPANTSSTWVTVNLPVTLPAYYQFIVDVTDNVTQCVNSDTLCVTFYEKPPLSIVSIPNLDVCEGTPVILIPNINNTSLYDYLWSNGATIPVITVSTAGFYSLTITDKATGCSTTAFAGSINPKPDLSLFPIGCDHLCDPDSLHLYIPLPLNWLPPFNTYANAYPSITWKDFGTVVGTGPTLVFPAGTSGNHQFSVIVQNQFGCIDSAGVFCLTNGCCNIDLDSLVTVPATCPESANGSFTILLDPASSGGPFTITSIPIVPPLPTTIIPGIPLTVSNLPPGVYTIIITGPTEGCSETYIVDIGHLQDECCFAEYDSLFVKILTNTTYTTDVVWDGKYYIDDNVIVTVTNGAVLDITVVDVVFGECAGIVFTNGAMLRSSNSVYRPCDVDKTWKGLRFVGKGEFDNIINECTFKNAEVALYFQQNADGVVSSNLFSNCNYGIRVEANNSFNHPISGNRFVTEQFFPDYSCLYKYPFINNSSTYAIYSTASRFRQQLSHNEFINTWGSVTPRTYGIYQVNGGGTFSYNTFTDLSYSIFLNSSSNTTIIENNEIEINELVNNTLAPVYITNCNNPVIEVNNNEISDNYHQYNCFAAIYVKSSSNVSMVGNRIDGFQYGIYAATAKNIQISRNEIIDSDVIGIYLNGKGNFKNYITCNEVKMRNFTNTRGLYTIDLTPFSEISSNCFNDSYVSMDIRTFTGAVLPKIRNNFLYNYNFAGINVVGYSGNIGTLSPPDPGMNTLWSNYNPAIDINSSTNITVADNFGMFNISWPTVQITSNRPYHSTASCAQQIFNMPSQGNLNVNYTCDNFKKLYTVIAGSDGLYGLSPDYKEQLESSLDQYTDAGIILASVEPVQPWLFEEISGLASLTENEKAVLEYNYYYRNSDFINARIHISRFIPASEDEADFKNLRLYDLDVIENGWDVLPEEADKSIEMIADKKSENSNFAISLLNNSPDYRDYLFDVVELPDVTASPDIKQIGNGESFLSIHPNPATDKVYIEFISNSLSESKIQLYDVSGKLVSNYTMSFVAGGIELDIRNLKEGFYIISLTDQDSGTIRAGKLIKARKSGQ